MTVYQPTVIVTGAASGIGYETAQVMMESEWTVVGVDIHEPPKRNPFADFHICDVGEVAGVQSAVEDVRRAYGPISGLVNCAAVAPIVPFLDSTVEQLEDVWRVNVLGTFICTQLVAKSMRSDSGGAIVNVGSVNSERGVSSTSMYSASKGAVTSLTKTLAVELANHGIRCNAVLPATTATERVLSQIRGTALDRRLSRIAQGRLGQPREVASLIAFLLSDDSSFITGAIVPVDGGYLAYGT
ncbi:SDR family oxidoreductase [Streptomyces sp. NPDC001982]|uniref:SDR family NAD(P)-dependent oxidoreductase n=1 Tax=Streptomyces sp. NPDC001982 TaxID=3154405 RepID=UPI00331680E8